MRRRFLRNNHETGGGRTEVIRFFPAGDYSFTVPSKCHNIDVFLVGGGGGGGNGYGAFGGGSGYTATYKKSNESDGSYNSWVKDGESINVSAGDVISITVGKGGIGGDATPGRNPRYGEDGESSFIIINGKRLSAAGGWAYAGETDSSGWYITPDGGVACSGKGGWRIPAQKVYSDGHQPPDYDNNHVIAGKSQGHTTRDFGEMEFAMNAGGTSGTRGGYGEADSPKKSTGYTEGSGEDGKSYSVDTYPYSEGGAGYGGAGGAGGIDEKSGRAYGSGAGGRGGDGTVVLRLHFTS